MTVSRILSKILVISSSAKVRKIIEKVVRNQKEIMRKEFEKNRIEFEQKLTLEAKEKIRLLTEKMEEQAEENEEFKNRLIQKIEQLETQKDQNLEEINRLEQETHRIQEEGHKIKECLEKKINDVIRESESRQKDDQEKITKLSEGNSNWFKYI